MSILKVRDMLPEDEGFVATCSHLNESQEIDDCARHRRVEFSRLKSEGATFKVALFDHEPIGFAYGIPIESSPWGPLGHNLMTIPCLYVLQNAASRGAGKALIFAIEGEAKRHARQAVTLIAYHNPPEEDWFMPASYFERLGYTTVELRGKSVIMWKQFSADASPPHFLQPHYVFQPVEGTVVVDLFWNAFCLTSGVEAQRVREVCQEFGSRILLREFPAENRGHLIEYQIPRGIYVNGKEIGWGFEAPKEGIRTAIQSALNPS